MRSSSVYLLAVVLSLALILAASGCSNYIGMGSLPEGHQDTGRRRTELITVLDNSRGELLMPERYPDTGGFSVYITWDLTNSILRRFEMNLMSFYTYYSGQNAQYVHFSNVEKNPVFEASKTESRIHVPAYTPIRKWTIPDLPDYRWAHHTDNFNLIQIGTRDPRFWPSTTPQTHLQFDDPLITDIVVPSGQSGHMFRLTFETEGKQVLRIRDIQVMELRIPDNFGDRYLEEYKKCLSIDPVELCEQPIHIMYANGKNKPGFTGKIIIHKYKNR